MERRLPALFSCQVDDTAAEVALHDDWEKRGMLRFHCEYQAYLL